MTRKNIRRPSMVMTPITIASEGTTLKILSQPDTGNVGDLLKANLRGNRFDKFSFLVAYVRTSGVNQIASSMQKFKGRVSGVVGVNRYQRNTSVQGLQLLLPLCDKVWVYNNESLTSTYHPKVYIFEKRDTKATVIVGSSNLTAGGLYSNYEVNSCFDYDLTDSAQAASFSAVEKIFRTYSTPSMFCKILTHSYLKNLFADGYLSNEENDRRERLEDIVRVRNKRLKRKFGFKRITIPRAPPNEIELQPIDLGSGQAQWAAEAKLLWRKQLQNRDLQLTHTGTAPTGGISLTQSDFMVHGKKINPRAYFRKKLFTKFKWQRDRAKSKTVATNVLFHVRIMGKDFGQHRLMLRHNPKWEARQHNYTTSISWGILTKAIKRRSLLDKTIALYAPPRGKKEPFRLEVS